MSEILAAAASEAEARLPRPPGVIRRAFAAHPKAVDIAIVVCYFIGCCMMLFIDAISALPFAGLTDGEQPDVPKHLRGPWLLVMLGTTLIVGAALFFRRRYPLAGLIVVSLILLLDQGALDFANGVALLFLLYAVPVFRSVAAGWAGFGIVVIGGICAYLLDQSRMAAAGTGNPLSPGSVLLSSGDPASWWRDFVLVSVMSTIWYLAVLMLGINLGNRRRYLAAVIDRAHQLARERDQLAQLAVAEERSRIAREMHDIVAHSVSVMIALSEGASRAASAAPEAAADAMQRSAETGRTALAEMRRLLGALNTPEASPELVPQPGIGELPDLVRSFTDAGVRVELSIAGEASGDRGQELAVYRVVQEGLTNVLRYAGTGARAVVAVHGSRYRTTVEVRDYGRTSSASLPVTGVGSGRGLAGLAERVRVFGGSFDSGPIEVANGGGWRIRAVLPVNADAQHLRTGTAAADPAPVAVHETASTPSDEAAEPTTPVEEGPHE